MKLFSLLLIFACCLCAVGCSSVPIDVRLGEQNQVNVNQDAADDEIMIDLLNRASAGAEDDDWKAEWTPGVAESVRKQNEASKEVADELLKNAQEKNKSD